MVVGAFGILEAELQTLACYEKPLADLEKELRRGGNDDLAERLLVFTKAVNVLKHGVGPSHSFLLQREDDLPSYIRLKRSPGGFFSEYDVAEIDTLVEVNPEFVAAAMRVIEEVVSLVGPWRYSQADRSRLRPDKP